MIITDEYTENSYLNMGKQIVLGLYDLCGFEKLAGGIIFNYNDKKEFNACSFINKSGQDCIEFNVGLVCDIFAYMKTVLSDELMFTEIGDFRNNSNRIFKGTYMHNTNQIWIKGTEMDSDRQEFSEYLSMFALRFIAAHEIGHLINGHCALLKKAYAIPKTEMIVKEKLPLCKKSYVLDRRTMEMDADAFAATCSIDNIIELYKKREDSEWEKIYGKLPRGQQIFRMWAFAVHSLFLIMEKECHSSYSVEGTYLPNEARSKMVVDAAFNAMESRRNFGEFVCTSQEYSIILQAIVNGIVEAEAFFNRKYGTNFNFLLNTYQNSVYKRYSDEVLEHWEKSLRKRLEKDARIPLYNPKTIDNLMSDLCKTEGNNI